MAFARRSAAQKRAEFGELKGSGAVVMNGCKRPLMIGLG